MISDLRFHQIHSLELRLQVERNMFSWWKDLFKLERNLLLKVRGLILGLKISQVNFSKENPVSTENMTKRGFYHLPTLRLTKYHDIVFGENLLDLMTTKVKSQIFRSMHQRCSVKKGVLKYVANFTGTHLRWSLFLIKLQALSSKAFNFDEKSLQHRDFLVKFSYCFRKPILKNIYERLLPNFIISI